MKKLNMNSNFNIFFIILSNLRLKVLINTIFKSFLLSLVRNNQGLTQYLYSINFSH